MRFALLIVATCFLCPVVDAKQDKKYYYVLGDMAWAMKSKAACESKLRASRAYDARLKKKKIYFESKWKPSCLSFLPPRFGGGRNWDYNG